MPIYKNSASVQVRGHFGVREWPPFSRDIDLEKSWASIDKAGGAAGFTYYPGGGDANRVLMKYTTAYTTAPNLPTAWVQRRGSASDFEALSETAISAGVAGLYFRNGNIDAESEFESVTALVPEGGAHCVQFTLPKPDGDYPVHYHRWGSGDARWSFEIIDGRARIVRLLPTWTEYEEGALWILKAVEEPTSDQQAQMADIEKRIYADEQSVELSSGQEWYAVAHEISFVPGVPGVFAVNVEGGKTQDVSNSAHAALIERRGPADTRVIPAWPLSTVTVGANGGAHGWVFGRLDFPTTRTLRAGTYNAPLGIDAGDVIVSVKGQPNGGTLTGEVVEVGAKHEIVITFTGDGTSSPIFTGGSAFAPGGERIARDDIVLDTANETGCAIMDIRPTFEKDGRRTCVEVEIRDIGGKFLVNHEGTNIYPGLETGGSYNFMHDRLADVVVNGSTLVQRGLIKVTSVTNIRGADLQAMMPAGYGNGDTRLVLTVSDWWAIVDEFTIDEVPDLSRARVGYALRALLGLPGFSASDMADISPTHGMRLPKDFKVERGDNLGDALRHIVDLFGYGDVLQARRGWKYGARSTTVAAKFVRGSAGFTERADPTDPTQRIFRGMDITRDFSEFYNRFIVIGGNDATGRPIVRRWTNWVSTGYGPDGMPIASAQQHPSYIGRVKEYPPVREESFKSVGAVNGALRSLSISKGRPGRFLEWSSWWQDDVLPGDPLLNCGIAYECERVNDGSVRDDRMQFSAMEDV
jgi:hypothetical protein